MAASANDLLDQLSRSFDAVDQAIGRIEPDQWTAPTPCTDWSVSRVVGHVIGMNRVFVAMLADEPPPLRQSIPNDELESAYRDTAAALSAAFSGPGVLERTIGVRSARPPAPGGCRSVSTICSLTGGI